MNDLPRAQFSPCRTWRYLLRRDWELQSRLYFATPHACSTPRRLGWVMLNPSTADETQLDPTLRRCRNFSMAWGYSGMVIANLFAFRSPYPKDLLSIPDPVGPENDAYLERLSEECGAVVLGWGEGGAAKKLVPARAARVRGLLLEHFRSQRVLSFPPNKSGSPPHPLYQSSKLKAKALVSS